MRAQRTLAFLGVALLAAPPRASADLTLFAGVTGRPSSRAAVGLAAGLGRQVVGIEFEFASTRADELVGAPSLETGMVNVLLQTGFVLSRVQLYGTVGGGIYHEEIGETQATHSGANVGGGIKVRMAGPVRLRLDYRLFLLAGSRVDATPQRWYAGMNLRF